MDATVVGISFAGLVHGSPCLKAHGVAHNHGFSFDRMKEILTNGGLSNVSAKRVYSFTKAVSYSALIPLECLQDSCRAPLAVNILGILYSFFFFCL